MREIKWICDICGKKYDNEEDVATHIMISDGPTGSQSDFVQTCEKCVLKVKEVIAQILKLT